MGVGARPCPLICGVFVANMMDKALNWLTEFVQFCPEKIRRISHIQCTTYIYSEVSFGSVYMTQSLYLVIVAVWAYLPQILSYLNQESERMRFVNHNTYQFAPTVDPSSPCTPDMSFQQARLLIVLKMPSRGTHFHLA